MKSHSICLSLFDNARVTFHCIYIYVYLPCLLYSFFYWWTLRLLFTLDDANTTAVNIDVHESFWNSAFVFFTKIPRSSIAGLYGSSLFSFLSNLCTVLHSGFTNLYSHQLYAKVLFSPHPHPHLFFMVFFDGSYSNSVRNISLWFLFAFPW